MAEIELILKKGFPAIVMHFSGVLCSYGGIALLLFLYNWQAAFIGIVIFLGVLFKTEAGRRIVEIRSLIGEK